MTDHTAYPPAQSPEEAAGTLREVIEAYATIPPPPAVPVSSTPADPREPARHPAAVHDDGIDPRWSAEMTDAEYRAAEPLAQGGIVSSADRMVAEDDPPGLVVPAASVRVGGDGPPSIVIPLTFGQVDPEEIRARLSELPSKPMRLRVLLPDEDERERAAFERGREHGKAEGIAEERARLRAMRLNGPMVASLRHAAAGFAAATVYPNGARQLIALIDALKAGGSSDA